VAAAYVDTWPPHCVRDTHGARLHRNLTLPDEAVVLRKGHTAAAHSGFEGCDEHGIGLAEILRRDGIDAVDVVGLATDYCVRATAMDASAQGLSVRVLADMVAGVAAESTERALGEMRATGIVIA
jgi:nicotinamidase/pyrazinamidase